MEQWIRSRFQVIPNGYERADGTTSDAFVFESGGKTVYADLTFFLDAFGSVSAPPTATQLKSVDPGDLLGWHRHFDAWVEQGIIQP